LKSTTVATSTYVRELKTGEHELRLTGTPRPFDNDSRSSKRARAQALRWAQQHDRGRIGTNGHAGRPDERMARASASGPPPRACSGGGTGANVPLVLLPRAQRTGALVVEAVGGTLSIQSRGRRTGHLVQLPLVAPRS
jgi:hypothetical protein